MQHFNALKLLCKPRALTAISAVVATAVCGSVVSAQNLYTLDEVVVTATRTEKALVDVPVRTEVVTREQIERTHARDLNEALRNVPGLVLRKVHGKTGYSVSLQGLGSNHVLVLIDGEPVSASTGSTVDLTQISTAEIERIEVVKGASSALYGSSAMGGVVNVITRRVEKPLAWSLTVDGGSWGEDDRDDAESIPYRHVGGNLSMRRGKWSVLAASDVRGSDGHDLDKRTFDTQGYTGLKYNVHSRISYYPDESSELYFTPKYYSEDIQNRFTTRNPGSPPIRKNKNEVATRATLGVGGKKTFDDESRLSGYAVIEQFDDYTEQDTVSTSIVDQLRDAKFDTAKMELQWDKPIGERHIVTLGAVYFTEELDQFQERNGVGASELIGDAERDNVEVFGQEDFFLNDQVELLFGARAQDDSDFGSYFAPKISVLYSPEWFKTSETRVRASVGRGYRVPNLKERFFVFDHTANGYILRGNRDLKPEESVNVQLGMEIIAEQSRFDINVFYNDIDQLISTESTGVQNGILQLRYTNIERARTQGMELGWAQQLGKSWDYNAAYTYLDSLDRTTGGDLKNRPEHQLKTELRYRHRPWQLDVSLFGTYQSEELARAGNGAISPSWTTWDLKFNKKLSPQFSMFFGVDNLGDVHREELKPERDHRPEAGRFYYAGVKISG